MSAHPKLILSSRGDRLGFSRAKTGAAPTSVKSMEENDRWIDGRSHSPGHISWSIKSPWPANQSNLYPVRILGTYSHCSLALCEIKSLLMPLQLCKKTKRSICRLRFNSVCGFIFTATVFRFFNEFAFEDTLHTLGSTCKNDLVVIINKLGSIEGTNYNIDPCSLISTTDKLTLFIKSRPHLYNTRCTLFVRVMNCGLVVEFSYV